jgi:penicillin-binding protein 1C
VEPVPGAQREPKILYPAADSLIALDPDIPEALQRVSFRAQAGQGRAELAA